jgi:dTDP-4-amino-4,6-dideoxygalactose transaminase
MSAGFSHGDEVIVPAQTHTATSHAVEYTGAKAIFADVDPITGNIDIGSVSNKITSNTKGIIPVHMAGYPCDMDNLVELCEKHDLILIEDCAHALGTSYAGKHAGNFGITGSFSFYPTKQIATGEGGMVISNDESVIRFVEKHKAFGIDTPPELRSKPGIYDVRGLGYNYRMTDFQAALAVGQVERYDENLQRRQFNARHYCEVLRKISGLNFPDFNDDCSYFLFPIVVDEKINRDNLLIGLKEHGIGLSIHYATPVPLMSYYRERYGYERKDFPNAVNYGSSNISLPVHPKITSEDIDYIAKTIEELL